MSRGRAPGPVARAFACVGICIAALATLPAAGARAAHRDAPAAAEFTDVRGAKALESEVAAALPRLLAASVGLVVIGPDGGATGSGTVITPDGLVLTAGHVSGSAGASVTVWLADGTTVEGRTLGLHWNGSEDAGLIQCSLPEGKVLPHAPLAPAESVMLGEWVIAIGHTYGNFREPNGGLPPARIGRIRKIRGDELALDIDAPLSSGDSGGGLFDLEGRLVGVNSSAGPEPSYNTATSVALVHARMDAMRGGEVSGSYALRSREEREAAGRAGRGMEPLPDDAPSRRAAALRSALAPCIEGALPSVAEVFVDSRSVGFAVAVDAEGHYIAKDSDVGDTSEDVALSMPDGVTVGVQRMARDRALDLVLLRSGESSEPIRWSMEPEAALGEFVVSAGRELEPIAWGIRSLSSRVAGRGDVTSAFLGVGVRPSTDEERAQRGIQSGAFVNVVTPATGAARARIARGDMIVSIDGQPIAGADDVGAAVRVHAAGDVVEIELVDEKGERRTARARLGVRAMESGPQASTPDHPASRRSSGFGEVIQHDSPMPATQMGSPLLDLDGHAIGLNIARVDRTKTYALPAPAVAAAASRLLAQAKERAAPLPVRDPMDRVLPTRAEGGLLRLDAAAAGLFGSTLALTPRGGEGIIGWASDRDSARWIADIVEPGEYEVAVIAACPSEHAGGAYEVLVDTLPIVGTVQPTSGWGDPSRTVIGGIGVAEPGRVEIRLRPRGAVGAPLMALHAIELKRVGDAAAGMPEAGGQ